MDPFAKPCWTAIINPKAPHPTHKIPKPLYNYMVCDALASVVRDSKGLFPHA